MHFDMCRGLGLKSKKIRKWLNKFYNNWLCRQLSLCFLGVINTTWHWEILKQWSSPSSILIWILNCCSSKRHAQWRRSKQMGMHLVSFDETEIHASHYSTVGVRTEILLEYPLLFSVYLHKTSHHCMAITVAAAIYMTKNSTSASTKTAGCFEWYRKKTSDSNGSCRPVHFEEPGFSTGNQIHHEIDPSVTSTQGIEGMKNPNFESILSCEHQVLEHIIYKGGLSGQTKHLKHLTLK